MNCDICGEPGELHTSPWGLPISMCLCRKHYYLLFLRSNAYIVLSVYIAVVLSLLMACSVLQPHEGVILAASLLLIRIISRYLV